MQNEYATIVRLAGNVIKEQLRHVDCFVSSKIALFMPMGRARYYASTPEHIHPSYMFIFHFNDGTSVKPENTVMRSVAGKVTPFSPNIPHRELPSDSPAFYIGMFIDKRFFEKQFSLYSKKKAPLFRGESHDADAGLFPLLKQFMIEADSRIAGSPAMLDALAIEICHGLIRSFIKAPAARDRMADRIEICRVIEYLYSHLGDKVMMDVLANIANLSPSYFARVFKQDVGKSPMEYAHDLRMERTRKELLAGDKSVAEIAVECGFGSTSYLSSSFQRAYGMRPSEYRRRRFKEEINASCFIVYHLRKRRDHETI